MSKRVATDIELIMNTTVDGHEVVFTGGLMYHLMKLYNTVDHFYLLVDIENGTGHYIATSVKEVLSITKWNLKTFEDVLSGVEQKVKFKILTESELRPILEKLSTDQVFLTGLINVNHERLIQQVGDRVYK